MAADLFAYAVLGGLLVLCGFIYLRTSRGREAQLKQV